jgi:hypothetical protein
MRKYRTFARRSVNRRTVLNVVSYRLAAALAAIFPVRWFQR